MTLRIRAPGKVNLGLEVIGRRPDGLHEIRSVAHTVALFDIVKVGPAPHMVLHAPSELGPASENLAMLAAELVRRTFDVAAGARVWLRKGIPVSAGLGGGSSDAAATVRLLRRFWSIPAPLPRFFATAAEIGSDVPFFLTGGAAFLEGRGERLERLPNLSAGCFVLVVPPWVETNKTARVYAGLHSSEYSDGSDVAELAASLRNRDPILPNRFVNSLYASACRLFPGLPSFREKLEALTGQQFSLSGAGPTLFHLSSTRAMARQIAERAHPLGSRVYIARPLARPPRLRVIC